MARSTMRTRAQSCCMWYSGGELSIRLMHFPFNDFLYLNDLGNCTRYQRNKPIVGFYIEKCIEIVYCFTKKKFITIFYLMICDFFLKKIWLKLCQKPDVLGKNGGQIQIQHAKLHWKWHISSHEHIGHIFWPVFLVTYQIGYVADRRRQFQTLISQ